MSNNITNFSYQRLHPHYANGEWNMLSFFEQMGNISSEVGRTFLAQSSQNHNRMMGAFWRMLELIDLTLADTNKPILWKRELRRAREILCDYILGDNVYHTNSKSLEQYFHQFALMARANK